MAVAADSLPRHLTNSASSSSNPSPARTPPATANSTFQPNNSSYTRSPASTSAAALAPGAPPLSPPVASPSLAASQPASTAGPAPPGSPSISSSSGGGNRFSLNLGFIARRPRGWTTSSLQQRSPGGGPPLNLTASPQSEMPPSPSGNERSGSSSGYGFPGLRRTLSKRNSSSATASGGAGGAGSGGETSRSGSRQRRSTSQPPVPRGGVLAAAAANGAASENRPNTSNASGHQQQQQEPAFPDLAATTSLPNSSASEANAAASSSTRAANASSASSSGETYKIRLVPHLESSRSLHFEPIERDLAALAIIRIGRFTDRHGTNGSTGANAARGTPQEPARIAFKSKVVSRGHAEIWVDESGKFFIRDTKSSSGTFLNHIRLAGPNIESRPMPLKDGDVLQLGVDYQGGTEEIYRCVKMRVELNRGWQRGANSFNTAALAQLRALGGFPDPNPSPGAGATSSAVPLPPAANGSGLGLTGMSKDASASVSTPAAAPTSAATSTSAAVASASITDCCICLYPVTVCQALFIAPCSHVTHFKCIRPLIEQNYPGFSCPLCRTYAHLEADVEIDLPEPTPAPAPAAAVVTDTVTADPESMGDELDVLSGLARRSPPMDAVLEAEEPASRAPSIRASGLGRSRPPSIAPSGAGLQEDDIDMEDAPAGDEDLNGVDEEEEEDAEDAAGGESAGSSSREAVNESDEPASRDFASSVPAMAIASPKNLPAHLAPPAPCDIYASLASAATPPNSTFLSTLAESAGGAARSAASAVFGYGAGGGAVGLGSPSGSTNTAGAAAIVPTSALARPPTSLDAAVLSEAGPSTVSLARSGSGSGTHGSDGEDVDAADVVETDTSSAVAVDGEDEGAEQHKGKGKGKGKDKKRRSLSTSLFPPRDSMDHPDPAVAAALLI
ncbi:hypothetical protein JCM10908_004714 [Rhodotorula pacifica]|uniref:uncharacterized protein n=1 Tax=Rhodotorula pacifica TaxID=1495444 RepID=UPI003178F7F1